MLPLIKAILLALLVIYLVPFVIYGLASVTGAVRLPAAATPGRFLGGVLVTKLGTAIAFVAIFAASQPFWDQKWPLYALIWFVMFAFSEVGELVSGRSTKPEALLGVASEAIYTPLAAFLTQWLLGRGPV